MRAIGLLLILIMCECVYIQGIYKYPNGAMYEGEVNITIIVVVACILINSTSQQYFENLMHGQGSPDMLITGNVLIQDQQEHTDMPMATTTPEDGSMVKRMEEGMMSGISNMLVIVFVFSKYLLIS